MEHALQPLEEEQNTGSSNYFALGIAASVILHLVCTVVLMSLPAGSQTTQSVTYVDLSTIQQPTPMPAPQTKAPLEPVAPEPETPVIPETPIAPPEEIEPSTDVQQQPVAPPEPVAEQLSQTSLGLGLTKGYFKSLGSGETLREDIKDYYLEMLQGVNEKWWLDPKLDKRGSTIVVNITVARNGEIVASQILTGSGDNRYDRAVLAALAAASPLPPLPITYNGEFFQAPIRLVPPLNLMAW